MTNSSENVMTTIEATNKAPPYSAWKQVKVKIERNTVRKPFDTTLVAKSENSLLAFEVKKVDSSLLAFELKKEEIPTQIDDSNDKCCNCTKKKDICIFWENHSAYREIALKVKNKNKDKFPLKSTKMNSSIRWHTYREYVRFHHPGLQRGQRIRIPVCVVTNIREMWPNEEDDEYAGHKYMDSFWYTNY